MKPLIYLASFVGHYLDAGSRKAAHSYAVTRVRLGKIHSQDHACAAAIVLTVILWVAAAVAGVLK